MHTVLMECVRDTLSTKLPSDGVPLFDGGENIEEMIPLGASDPGDVLF